MSNSIPFSDKAEHVEGIRSPYGNIPHIVGRILAHKKAKGVTIFAGTARNHRGNPAASIIISNIYATPVLFSGLSSPVLKTTETALGEKYKAWKDWKKMTQNSPLCLTIWTRNILTPIWTQTQISNSLS